MPETEHRLTALTATYFQQLLDRNLEARHSGAVYPTSYLRCSGNESSPAHTKLWMQRPGGGRHAFARQSNLLAASYQLKPASALILRADCETAAVT